MENNMVEECELSRFYNGKSVFITGATGFMGKVLVHKLLTSCSHIGKIYLLIRPKRGKDASERLEALLDGPIFSSIRTERADLLKKLVVVAGDITEPKLGLNDEDVDSLIRDVSIVFHSAATVKFDEDLTKSVNMNVVGTRSVLELARQLRNLEAVVHVSTAYAHCHQKNTTEKFYPLPGTTPDEIIALCQKEDEAELNSAARTKAVIGRHPNTYCFTKALAEQLVMTEAAGLPLAIVRPSIVVAAWKDPVPGWVDNFNGPTGIIAGAASGILRTILVSREKVADLIPVDVAINVMCSAAWFVGSRNTVALSQEIPIYNCTSGSINPIRWGQIESWGLESILKHPLDTLLWYPGGSFKTSPAYDRVCRVIFHYIPAYIVDFVMMVLRKKPFMKSIVAKMTKGMEALEYFSTREWTWDASNLENLGKTVEAIGDKSDTMFYFDIKSLDWVPFIEKYVLGTRHFVLKNKPETIVASRKKLRTYHFAHILVQVFFVMFMYGLFLFLFSQ